jgi:threonine/homoserine/homoserine lactone efflux protein
MSGSLLLFIGISAFVIVTPGPGTALTIRNTLLGGRGGGIATAFGVSTGQLIWALATCAGVVALLLASEVLFQAVKLAGATYLVYLGLQALLAAARGGDGGGMTAGRRSGRRLRPVAAFRQGIVNDLANPKMAVFFASVLPQFAPEGQGMFSTLVLLGLLFSGMTFAWLAVYAFALSAAGGLLRRSRLRRGLEAVTGTVLVALGLRLAAEQR